MSAGGATKGLSLPLNAVKYHDGFAHVLDAYGETLAAEATHAEADAIVLACNTHPALVSALTYARRFLNEQDHDVAFVDAALRLAKGGRT